MQQWSYSFFFFFFSLIATVHIYRQMCTAAESQKKKSNFLFQSGTTCFFFFFILLSYCASLSPSLSSHHLKLKSLKLTLFTAIGPTIVNVAASLPPGQSTLFVFAFCFFLLWAVVWWWLWWCGQIGVDGWQVSSTSMDILPSKEWSRLASVVVVVQLDQCRWVVGFISGWLGCGWVYGQISVFVVVAWVGFVVVDVGVAWWVQWVWAWLIFFFFSLLWAVMVVVVVVCVCDSNACVQ